jgi:DNA repair protein SbcC/Rad50
VQILHEQLERERHTQVPIQVQREALQQVSSLAQRMKALKLSADLSHPEPMEWDEERYQEIREVLRQRTALQTEELAWQKSEQTRAEQKNQLEALEHQQNAAEQRFNQSLMDWQQAVRLESNRKATLEAAQLRDLAHGLRHSLRLGEACPVCEQSVSQLPSSQTGALEQAQEQFKQAEQARVLLEKQNRDLDKALTQLQAQYHNEKNNFAVEQTRLEQEKIRLDQVRASLDPQATLEGLWRLEAALVQQVRQVVGEQSFETALERNQDELKRLEKLLEVGQKQKSALEGQLAQLVGSLQSDSQRLSEGQTQLEVTKQDWKARKAALGEREPALEMDRLLAGLALRVRQVTGGKPLGLLRSSLNNQIQHLQSDLEGATLAHSQATQQGQSAKSAWEYAQKHRQDLHSQHTDLQEALERALAPLHLTRADVRDQALEPHITGQLEQRIQSWQQAHRLVLSQQETLEAEWQGRSYHPSLHRDLQNQLTELSQSLERLTAQQGALLERHSRLAHDLQSKTDLERKRGELSRSYDIYKSLDNALRSDGFPKYLLEELENELLRQGSELLLELSDGRYRLALEDGEYMVVDDWNAGISRGVKTLSGGETFLASLSLAISLSDYLAGNKRLGALFLDEGFGTLDSEALEAVTKALEHLQSSGRMVGVITHVSSLAERLPSRVRVFKHSQGSRLEVEA